MSTNIDFDRLNTVILSKYQNLSDFCCRKEKYNVFLCEEALDYQEEKLGITYLWYYTDGLVAFVTLSTGGLRGRWIVSEDRPGLEVEYIPALMIGQLAVDKNFERSGIGSHICLWAIGKGLKLSDSIGCRMIILNADGEDAINFYKKNGFKLAIEPKNRREPFMYFDLKT